MANIGIIITDLDYPEMRNVTRISQIVTEHFNSVAAVLDEHSVSDRKLMSAIGVMGATIEEENFESLKHKLEPRRFEVRRDQGVQLPPASPNIPQ